MPWSLRQRVYLILLGVVALVLSLIVMIRNETLSTTLLGGIGLVGGLAMILVALPSNGSLIPGVRRRKGEEE
jgi:hypothetical protein